MPSTQGIRAGRAFVELFADDTKLVRGLRAAETKLKAFGSGIRNLGLEMAGLGAAALAPMLGAAKGFADMGSRMWDMSKRTGVSVEALSSLGYAAEQSGAGIEAFENGIRRMQRTIYDAGRGLSTATDSLADLGLTVKDLAGLSPEQQFRLLADRLDQIGDPTRKAAIAMTIFGRSGTQLLPMLEGGTAALDAYEQHARKLGLVMSTKDAAAADAFGDALDDLWKVLKMSTFTIGAALAPALQQVAQTITSVVAKVVAWLQQNRQLVITVMQVAAAVVAGGIAMAALGTIISGLGSAFGVLATIATGVGTVFKVLGAVIGFLISPIGLVITAVAALGSYLIYASGAGGKALTWLCERFNVLKEDALAAFQGVSDALAAGDIGLAVKVLWLTVKMEWTRGVNFLEKAWLNFRNFFIKVGCDAWYGLLAVAQTVWHGLEVGWIETTAFFSRLWAGFVSFFAGTWESIKAGAKKAWNWIKSLFDDSVNLEAENKLVDQEKNAAIAKIDDEQQRNIAQRESQRQAQRDQAARVHEATLGQIGQESLEKHQQLDAQYERKMADNQADLDKARQEWRDALDEARSKRQAKEAGDPGTLNPADDVNSALAGIGDLVGSGLKEAVRGTFNVAAIQGLQASGAAERTAKASEETAKNTKKIASNMGASTLTFA